MDRDALARLRSWLTTTPRKPLVLRGARQVGKTWLVRALAREAKLDLVEINFERDPQRRSDFAGNDPATILGHLGLRRGIELVPSRTLLFLDEVQAAPEVYAKLRWFAEELPELAVAAAGSLLELALGDGAFRAPVGRIGYRHVEPLGFPEFLRAHGQDALLAALAAHVPHRALSATTHEVATGWLHRYLHVGGMPAVVALDAGGATPRQCRDAQRELMATYRDDFGKYIGRMRRELLDATLLGAARMLGQKFVYARVGEGLNQASVKHALELLVTARLCHFVTHSHARGMPLGGETKDTMRKVVMLDIGLVHALLETPAGAVFPRADDLAPQVRGQLMEQLAGQALRLCGDDLGDGPRLYYWQREGGRAGEIDYLLDDHGHVLPIELKSGSAGSMKSLHQFMADRAQDGPTRGAPQLAVRVDQNPPSLLDVDVRTTQGDEARYTLLSVPPYLLHRLPELTRQVRGAKPPPAARARKK